MSKKSRFRAPFEQQRGKRTQARFKSASHRLYHINWSLPYQLSWKESILLTWKILGLLVSTSSTDEKCPLLKRRKLMIPIQMELPQKRKTFPQFFAAFFKSCRNLERLEEKDDPYSFCISEITDSENVVR